MGLTDKMCRVTVDGELREYPKGTAYQRIAEEFQDRYEHQIILAYEGAYRLRELSKTLEEDCSSGLSRRQTGSDTVRIREACAFCW